MRVVTIVGARPQFVKLAPVSRAMQRVADGDGPRIEDIIVHTGQHYDPGMSDVFFDELQIPRPSVELHVGSGPHGAQTGRMLEKLEQVLLERRPDAVIVYGDTNSTLAGALAAAKLHVPIAHVEAGLRSFNREMPEETNRIVADHVSELLLAPTQTAMDNLAAENLSSRSVYTGDVMLDAVRFNVEIAARRSDILDTLDIEAGGYAVATLHRPANTDAGKLKGVLETLDDVARRHIPIVFPAHPRTTSILASEGGRWQPSAALRIIDPVGYLDMLTLLKGARLALTDSGGLQKEALFLDTPCVTLREETEWPETIEAGGNVLVGSDRDKTLAAVSSILAKGASRESGDAAGPFGDGNAADRIVAEVLGMAGG